MNIKRIILLAAAICCFGYVASANSQYKLYAGFVYHFAKFTQWPSDKQSGDFVIGVIGSSDMVAATKALASTKQVGNRRIVVKSYSSATEAKGCHILFISKSMNNELVKARAIAKDNSFLVITESENATAEGSTINFVSNSGKVQFELSKSAALSQGLKISSELQKLAIMKS